MAQELYLEEEFDKDATIPFAFSVTSVTNDVSKQQILHKTSAKQFPNMNLSMLELLDLKVIKLVFIFLWMEVYSNL